MLSSVKHFYLMSQCDIIRIIKGFDLKLIELYSLVYNPTCSEVLSRNLLAILWEFITLAMGIGRGYTYVHV